MLNSAHMSLVISGVELPKQSWILCSLVPLQVRLRRTSPPTWDAMALNTTFGNRIEETNAGSQKSAPQRRIFIARPVDMLFDVSIMEYAFIKMLSCSQDV